MQAAPSNRARRIVADTDSDLESDSGSDFDASNVPVSGAGGNAAQHRAHSPQVGPSVNLTDHQSLPQQPADACDGDGANDGDDSETSGDASGEMSAQILIGMSPGGTPMPSSGPAPSSQAAPSIISSAPSASIPTPSVAITVSGISALASGETRENVMQGRRSSVVNDSDSDEPLLTSQARAAVVARARRNSQEHSRDPQRDRSRDRSQESRTESRPVLTRKEAIRKETNRKEIVRGEPGRGKRRASQSSVESSRGGSDRGEIEDEDADVSGSEGGKKKVRSKPRVKRTKNEVKAEPRSPRSPRSQAETGRAVRARAATARRGARRASAPVTGAKHRGARATASRPKGRHVVLTDEHFEPINTWWDEENRKRPSGVEWDYLEHSGLIFHPAYTPHNLPIKYKNKPFHLPPHSEEIINFWCGTLNSEYPSKKRFVRNFWHTFVRTLPSDHPMHDEASECEDGDEDEDEDATSKGEGESDSETSGKVAIYAHDQTDHNHAHAHAHDDEEDEGDDDDRPLVRRTQQQHGRAREGGGDREKGRKGRGRVIGRGRRLKFKYLDLSDIVEYLEGVKEAEKVARKNATKEERDALRLKKMEIEGKHMYALHDFIREKVASYKTEVPGLFRGRGEHPKMGKLKRRIFPDEVCLNLSEDAPVPRVPEWLAGHSWQDVYHDNRVTWLAFYRDTVNSSFKYVFLAPSSAVKGMKDHKKYELARKLKNFVGAIRKDYTQKMKSNDVYERQMGTATYVIDALALRVGNEKDREEEADTVGCCSLRVEHITSMDDARNEITLDFLGKDSIRYLNTVTLMPLAYKNIKSFYKGKKLEENLFDQITTGSLNRYLKDLMPSLSAKVFRTYNASITLQDELAKTDGHDLSNIEIAKRFFENANRQVAILCNHQRSVPKQHDVSMAKLQKQATWLLEDLEELRAAAAYINSSHKHQIVDFKWKPAEPLAERADTDPVRVSVVKPTMKLDQIVRKIGQLEQRTSTLDLRIRVKDENKTVANNTSKQHYMDPRITVTFCKNFDLPIEKFFNASLLKKFPWAMYAKCDFVW